MEDEDAASYQLRACEHCRHRKIKCDRKVPCASCRSLQIECRPGTRPVTGRVRSHQSPSSTNIGHSHAERQIAEINHRLASIDASLRHLASRPQHAASPPLIRSPSAISAIGSPSTAVPTYDEESSFEIQSMQAGAAADRTIARALGSGSSQQLKIALDALVHTLKAHNLDAKAHQAFLSPPEHDPNGIGGGLPLPPTDIVTAVVRRLKVRPPLFMSSFFPQAIYQIEDLCRQCYFPSGALPAGSYTVLYGLLFFTMRDYIHNPDSGFTEAELLPTKELCERNFYKSVQTYLTLATPTFENVESLFLAAVIAQEEQQMQLLYTYVSSAATMCYSLNLHRRSSLSKLPPDERELKKIVFWHLYAMDRNLCFNLSRRSRFNDDDIDQDILIPSSDPRQKPVDQMNNTWFAFAKFQGDIYDRLYCLRAALRSPDERRVAVTDIAARFSRWAKDATQGIDISTSHYPSDLKATLDCIDPIHYTVLCAIHRAQTDPKTSTEITAECFTYARLALESHVRCAHTFLPQQSQFNQHGYVTWNLLYLSFTPFIIHFVWTISNLGGDRDAAARDLALLEAAVDVLRSVRETSAGTQRLYRVCAAFLVTAQALVNSRHASAGITQLGDGSVALFSSGQADQPVQSPVPFTQDVQGLDALAAAIPMGEMEGIGQDGQQAPPDWSAWSDMFPDIVAANGGKDVDMAMFLGNWLGDGRPVVDVMGLGGE